MTDLPPIAALFCELAEWLVRKTGTTPLERRVYAETINEDWSLVFNCTMEEVPHEGVPIPPMTFVLSWKGWPGGVVDPFGGALMCGWDSEPGAAERELSAVLRGDMPAEADCP